MLRMASRAKASSCAVNVRKLVVLQSRTRSGGPPARPSRARHRGRPAADRDHPARAVRRPRPGPRGPRRRARTAPGVAVWSVRGSRRRKASSVDYRAEVEARTPAGRARFVLRDEKTGKLFASYPPAHTEIRALLRIPLDLLGLSAAVRQTVRSRTRQPIGARCRLKSGGGGIRTLDPPQHDRTPHDEQCGARASPTAPTLIVAGRFRPVRGPASLGLE